MLEGGGGGQAGGLLQGLDQLPGVERVHKIDVPRLAVEDGEGQLTAFHKNAGGLLVGIAAIFQFQFGHVQASQFYLSDLFLMSLFKSLSNEGGQSPENIAPQRV